MMKRIWMYLKAWVNGEDAELDIDKTFSFSWWEMVPIVIIVGIIIYWIWK